MEGCACCAVHKGDNAGDGEMKLNDDIQHKCMRAWKEFKDGNITLEQLIAVLEIIAGDKPNARLDAAREAFGAEEV